MISNFLCVLNLTVCDFDFVTFICRQTLRYLEFLSLVDAKNQYESKFDYDPFDTHSSGGDIVYKILGIEPDQTISRAPSIILSKKVRREIQDNTIEEEPDALGPPNELESLKHLFKQEESRDDILHTPHAQTKMQKITSSSKSLLAKKMQALKLMHHSSSTEHEDSPLHESESDISLYKPVVSLRESANELGSNIIKKVKHTKAKYGRPTTDGVGMATLLVRSMMTAPSLDSIAENADIENMAPTSMKSLSKSDFVDLGSMIQLPTKKQQHFENKLNISVGDSIIDLKATDGNLSSGMSSITVSESSSEDDDDEECSELGDEVVMIDADTISM